MTKTTKKFSRMTTVLLSSTWQRLTLLLAIVLMGMSQVNAQSTINITCTGTTGSLKSGSVNSAGTKSDGNLVNITTSNSRGWATFDLSIIPTGSTIVSANVIFTTYSSTLSGATNSLYGFTGDPATMLGTTLYNTCGGTGATLLNSATWAAGATETKAVTAGGLTQIASNFGNSMYTVGFLRGSTNTYNIYGYSGATPPVLQITYVSSVPCSGTPNPGNTVASASAVCPSTAVNLSLQNPSVGSGITYQWESADDAAFTMNVQTLGTNSTQSSVPTGPTYYRCSVTCAGNTGVSTPVLVSLNSFVNCYCGSSATSTADEEILNVTFGTLNNTSACGDLAGGPGSVAYMYSNYAGTAVPIPSVMQLDVVPFSVQVGTCGGNYNNQTAIWIDYNQNGLFTDPGEKVYASVTATNGPHFETGTINIPIGAAVGQTRMRVINTETSTALTDPCASYSWGETEDYIIDIQATSVCAGVPAPGNTIVPASICPNITFPLGLQNTTPGTGVTYLWESADDQFFTLNVQTVGTSQYQTTSQTTDKWYRCLVDCAGNSAYSTEAFVSTNGFISCYCTPSSQYGTSGGSYGSIFNVNFDVINNTTTYPATAPYYTDYPTPVSSVTQGQTIPFSVNVGGYSQAGVWFDWDQSGTFDASEFTYLGTVSSGVTTTFTSSVTVPFTAVPGPTKMRFRGEAYFYTLAGTDACTNLYYGETEDYMLDVFAASVCTGLPTPGNTIASSTSVCPGENITLTLQNFTPGTGVTYQWESADDQFFTLNVTSLGTGQVENTSQTSDKWYRCLVDCGGNSAYSTEVLVNTNSFLLCYCASAATNAADEEIYNVTIAGGSTDPLYANANGCTTAAPGPGSILSRYSNFKTLAPIATITQLDVVPFSIDENECDGATYYSNGIAIWIDYNQNGVYTDPGEQVYVDNATSAGPKTVSGTFTVPITAVPGTTTMRVICAEGYSGTGLTPCLSYGYGETEDYLIDIVATTPCAGVPTPGNTIAPASICPNTNFALGLQNVTPGTGVTYLWESADDQFFTLNVQTVSTNQYPTTSQTSDKWYRCLVDCGGNSAYSTEVLVTTNGFISCYCTPTSNFGVSSPYGDITNVSFASINQASGVPATPPYFTYYPTPVANVTQGQLIPLDVSVGGYSQAAVWFDWDQSGTFDASEYTYLGTVSSGAATIFTNNVTIPMTATPGQTRMRIRSEAYYNTTIAATDGCTLLSEGETEDYIIEVFAAVPCVGVPTPGNTLASATTYCPGGAPINLSLQNYTSGTGVTYQWEQADDQFFTTNLVSLGTTSLQTVNPTSGDFWYRCLVDCGGNSAYSTEIQITQNSALQCYCIPTLASTLYGCTDGDVIAQVEINQGATNLYTNNSGTGCPGGLSGYSDYTGLGSVVNLQAGNTYACTVFAGQWSEHYTAWVDYNDDGNFDASERIGYTTTQATGSGSVGVLGGSASFPITLACNPPTGAHRMRVRCAYGMSSGLDITPCALTTSSFGETEDYIITIDPALPCPAPSAFVLNAGSETQNSATFSWTPGCTETAWNLEYGPTGFTAGSGTMVPATTNVNALLSGLSCGQTYDVYVYADCSSMSNGASSPVGPIAVSTTACPPSSILNATFFIQGYYAGASTMQSVLLNQGVGGALATEADDVTVDLMDATSPYAMVYTFTGRLLTNGTISCTYPAAAIGNSYYIRLTNRNSIETWSAAPVTMASVTSYDFSSASTQAFGSNQVDAALDGVYSIYNGDVTQDGAVDIFDFLTWDADNQAFAVGYYNTDFNGDGVVDIFDFLVWDPNNQNFIGIVTP